MVRLVVELDVIAVVVGVADHGFDLDVGVDDAVDDAHGVEMEMVCVLADGAVCDPFVLVLEEFHGCGCEVAAVAFCPYA